MPYPSFSLFVIALILIFQLSSCQSDQLVNNDTVKTYYNDFPVPSSSYTGWEKYAGLFQKDMNHVNKFGLSKLPLETYKHWRPATTLPYRSKMIDRQDLKVDFFPLNQDTAKSFEYIHEFNCVYNPKDFRYADVAYPNPCLGPDTKAKAKVVLTNNSQEAKTIYCRMFYQNTSYWYPTNAECDHGSQHHLTNYYGGAAPQAVQLAPGESKQIFMDYVIGQDPKGNSRATKLFYGPARPGAYEFMLWTTEDSSDVLIQDSLNYATTNPFAYFSQKHYQEQTPIINQIAYLHSTHFKFVFLRENFDAANIYNPGDVYILGNKDEKPLCDTCTGYFKDVIADEWTHDDFFKGYIKDAPWTKADYGIRNENVRIDENGIYLKTPGSSDTLKQKTWGEVKFGPSFLYGTVKVVAKFSQLRNKESHTPNGTVHNLWLYQYNHPYADPIPGHPYAHLVNDKKKQPYEIDIEIWSKIYDENWNGGSAINYSIVDYMRNADAIVKPGEDKDIDGSKIDRRNNRQLNFPGTELLKQDFFEQYHLYEIIWMPYHVVYKIDGKQVAKIDWRMAKIPDEYCFLWIGSPIYQDGTYYDQRSIPFPSKDKFTHIRYISIE